MTFHKNVPADPAEQERVRDALYQQLLREAQEVASRYRKTDNHELIPSVILRAMLGKYHPQLTLTEMQLASHYIQQLEHAAGEDTLTGVPNRGQYDRYLSLRFAQHEQQRRQGEAVSPMAMAVIDIDFFKKVNAAGGHQAGDLVLQELTRVIRSVLRRASDVLFRYGGEEFVIVMPETTGENGHMLMERVREAVERDVLPAVMARMPAGPRRDALEALKKVTVSIGVSELRDEHRSPKELFAEADAALYSVKKGEGRTDVSSRNRVAQFSEQLRSVVPSRVRSGVLVADSSEVSVVMSEERRFFPTELSPQQIFSDFRQEGERWTGSLTVGSPTERSKRLYPSDSIIGLQWLFSRQRIQDAMRADPGSESDIQNVAMALRHLEQAVMIDTLTQLPNRRAFDKTLERELAESTRDQQTRGLIVFDVDHFKRLNDQFGHAVGDVALRAFGEELAAVAREDECIARLGGEEFGVIFRARSVAELTSAAERIRSHVEQRVLERCRMLLHAHGTDVQLDRRAFTVSMGCALSELHEHRVGAASGHERVFLRSTPGSQLYVMADTAAFVAKGDLPFTLEGWFQPGQSNDPTGLGRNRWVVYDSRMEQIQITDR